jgi:hypothetical protein
MNMEIRAILQVENEKLIAVQLLSGEVDVNMVLKVIETGEEWLVINLGHTDSRALALGRRDIALESLGGQGTLQPGMHLVEVVR